MDKKENKAAAEEIILVSGKGGKIRLKWGPSIAVFHCASFQAAGPELGGREQMLLDLRSVT